jgi:hypothetical protein
MSRQSIAKQIQARLRRVTQSEIAQRYPHYPRPSQVKTFYAAMGRAIASWQSVETQLYEVYRACTHARIPGAEAAAFYSVPAFRTKLNFTKAAVEFVAHGEPILLDTWHNIMNRAARKSDRRNEIAHGAVWTQFQERRKERKIYLGPNLNDPRETLKHKPGQDVEPLTLRRVRGYEKDFRALAREIAQFARQIRPLATRQQGRSSSIHTAE